jgi:hypothetical protein
MRAATGKRWLLIYVIIATIIYWIVSFWEASLNSPLLIWGYIINTSNEVLLVFMWIYKAADRRIVALLFLINLIGEFFGSTLFHRFVEYLI